MSSDLPGGTQPGLGDNPYRQMVLDAAGSNFGKGSSSQCYRNIKHESPYHYEPLMEEVPDLSMEEEPNPDSQRFYDLLQSADRELYPGSSFSQLALVSRMLNIKMENTLSQRGYNQMMQLFKEALPEANHVLDNYCHTKKLVCSLGLPVKKIDCCNSGCILYWDDDKDLTSCKFCGYERYKRHVGSRWSTSGNLACPYCMDEPQSFRLHYGGKTTWFDSHMMFLDQNHPFRKDRKNFLKGHTVTRSSPPVRTGQEILNHICELGITKVTDLDVEEVNKRLCKSCGWKKRSIFWDLPYWSSNMIRHNLDVMHIEKNVFDNVFSTVLNVDGKTKNDPKARQDVAKYCDWSQLARNPDGSYPKAA
ncbi:uncharacterized protein LOC125839922 [Solanum verrucosum]|uniref:uncharacterized protein LOC125839922 n=1 Tax=Solanum verrucosum TaxID=315347 RepID=UPI0020D14037|nr:uncharacterized protein LOC125839922 [Solanum verrucosum]